MSANLALIINNLIKPAPSTQIKLKIGTKKIKIK